MHARQGGALAVALERRRRREAESPPDPDAEAAVPLSGEELALLCQARRAPLQRACKALCG